MSCFHVREDSDAVVVAVEDPAPLNDFRSNAFRDSLYELVQAREEPRIALDLGAVDYLSSSGVAILVGLKRRVEMHHGKLVLFRAQPIVLDLLRIMKLTQFFTFAENEEEALASLRPVPAS